MIIRTRAEHHATMLKSLNQFLELAKNDTSTITCGVLACLTEFLGHFMGEIRKISAGMSEESRIDLVDIIGCQLTALNRCIADLQGCLGKITEKGETH